MTKKPSLALLVATVLAAAIALAACGGSSGSGSLSTTTEASPQGQQEGSAATGSGGEDGRRDVPVAPLEVSGGGSAQFHVKGGDNSVQDYGEEAGETELRRAAEATHSFLVATVRGEWGRACSLLSADEQKSLEQFTAQSRQLQGSGCVGALAALTPHVSNSPAREITEVDAASLRREGEQAFLIYVGGPEETVYAMPLRLEGGVWKPGAISAAALPGIPPR
jgi:hypothetical protein